MEFKCCLERANTRRLPGRGFIHPPVSRLLMQLPSVPLIVNVWEVVVFNMRVELKRMQAGRRTVSIQSFAPLQAPPLIVFKLSDAIKHFLLHKRECIYCHEGRAEEHEATLF